MQRLESSRRAAAAMLCTATLLVAHDASAQRLAYATNSFDNALVVLDVDSGSVTASIPVCTEPLAVAVTPRGKAIVPCRMGYTTAIVDLATHQVKQVFTGERPLHVALSPDGTRAYVTNSFGGTLSVIDTVNDTVVASVTIDMQPYHTVQQAAVSPDGSEVFVTSWGLAPIVAIVNTKTLEVETLPTGASPTGVAFSPDGTRAYVATDGTLMVFDRKTRAVTSQYAILPHASSIALTGDGTRAVISHSNTAREVSIVDLRTGQQLSTIVVGGIYPFDVDIARGGATAWVRSQYVVDELDLKTYASTRRYSVNGNGGIVAAPPTDVAPPTTTATLPPADHNGWYRSPVAVTLSADDGDGTGVERIEYRRSGPQTAQGSVAGSSAVVSVAAPGVTTLEYRAVDVSGNEEAWRQVTVALDDVAPMITINATMPSATAVNSVVPVNFTCSDLHSGIVSCTGSPAAGGALDTRQAGRVALDVSAVDGAGNVASLTHMVTVTYRICATYDESLPHKRGSTVPIKLHLCDASGANVSSPTIAVTATGVRLLSQSTTTAVEDSGNANPDYNFRYDAALGGYIYNLQTTGFSLGTYEVRFMAGSDPTTHVVRFVLGR